MKQNEDITYSVKTSTLTQWSELWIERSKIQINHDFTGFIEDIEEDDLQEVKKGSSDMFKRSVSDNHNGNKDDLVIYFNILLNNKATLYYGKHYTLIDIMEQQGGLTQCLMIIILIFSRPFLFKRHEITMFCDHENQFEEDQTSQVKSFVRKI